MTSHAATRSPFVSRANWKALGRVLGCGSFAGTALFLWTHQFLATFGTSVSVTAALAAACGFATLLGLATRSLADDTILARWLTPAAWLTIAAWTVTFAWMLSAARTMVGLIPMTAFSSEATAFCIMLPIAAVLFILPVAACLVIADSLRQPTSQASAPFEPLFVAGIALGLVAGPSLLAPLLGLAPLMIGITAISAAAFWRTMFQAVDDQSSYHAPRDERLLSRRLTPPAPSHSNLWALVRRSVTATLGLSLLIGLQVPVVTKFALQLMPGSPFEHYAVWSGLIAGIAVGMLWATSAARGDRKVSNAADGPMAAAVIATIWPVALLAVWGLLIDAFLTISATVSIVPLVMFFRIMTVALATAPLGIALGRLWSSPLDDSPSRPARLGESSNSLGIVCTVAGVVIMRSATVPPVTAVAVLSVVAMIAAVGRYWVLELPALSRRQRAAGLATVLAVALLPLVHSNYRPDVAAKLLFSTNTFSALQSGISRDLLPQLDDGRLIAMTEGRDSTWTVWKHRGSQLSLRENGLPRGMVSVDPLTSPQFAGELMPAIVPMVLHERPQSVLMLGIGSTASLSSVLACPVTTVTCVEGDSDLIALVDDVFAPAAGFNPLNDDRVRLLNVDPTLGLLAAGDRHDVLIVNEAQPSIMAAASGFTLEFYQAARQSLNAGGLLCQRLQYADVGRKPIEDLLATVQTVFPHVALFDAAPGEMLVIATSSEKPLVDESTFARCETTHIRNLMAQLGWDWSVLLNVAAVSPETVAKLTATAGTPNTVTNGRFAYGLPQEVMRWSSPQLPKWQERQQLLSANASTMITWIGESERLKDVQQRLADVIEQQRLIHEHPDHYWAYRKTLKERLKDRPRGIIQQVKHEGLKRTLHPEDERRKQYLEVLGNAATSDAPTAEAIEELTDFAVPYDPLVSHFLHQEAARLYEKSPDDDPTARFRHLRYSVYFGPPNDRSVRNVVSALTLLNDDPELIADPLARWDEMNSLLEVLKQRSSLRLRLDTSASSFEMIDAEHSIAIAKRTMTAMDALRSETNVPSDDWQQRKTVLERMLVRPMWTYHSQQAARLSKRDAQIKSLHAERDADTEVQ